MQDVDASSLENSVRQPDAEVQVDAAPPAEPSKADIEALPGVALFLGERLNTDAFEATDALATEPLVIALGKQGYAVLFSYGAAVLFGLEPVEEAALIAQLSSFVDGSFPDAEVERVEIRFHSDAVRAHSGKIWLQSFSIEQVQLVADVLSKSVVLAHYENQIAAIFDQLEPFSKNLQANTKSDRWSKDLLRQLGRNLAIQHKIVGRVEIIDKPDLLWDSPSLERLYSRLEDEYEIKERHTVLERKLELMTQTAETALGLLQHNTNLRVEWYIVALIVIEIILSLYDLFLR
ncbi:MAG: RMD1 family protein [Elainellaceae cyanobacterium]